MTHPSVVPSGRARTCGAGRGAECQGGECHEYRTDGDEANGQELPEGCDLESEKASRAKRLEMRGRSTKENWDRSVSKFVATKDLHLRESENVTWFASNCIEILKVICPHHRPERNRGDDGGDDGDERRTDDVGLRAPPGMQR